MKKIFYFLILVILFVNCKKSILPKNGAVVSARTEASKAGIEILKKGGNAFDAMIATDLVLNVTFPFAGSLGGGGFALIRENNGKVSALDYREMAPLKAHSDMFLDSLGNIIPNKSTKSGLASGVPGTIAGFFEIYEKWGSLPLETLFAPAIKIAENGFYITEKQAQRLNYFYEDFITMNKKTATIFKKDFKKGDIFKNQPLANTLKYILKNGKDGFYKGKIANAIIEKVKETGGVISLQDLENYKAKWRTPIEINYKDLKIYSMSPPSSGGICLGQILKMIAPYPIADYGHNSLKTIQVITEAERRSYADRSEFLGDPDFFSIPIDSLLDDNYLKNRMKDFSFDAATPSTAISYGKIEWKESEETTHYSIVDKQGNAISVTTTLNGAYGSKIYVDSLGFFLNNEMDDFSIKVGTPNMFGLIGNKANAIEPQKRMLSSMTPTIVEKNGNLYMVVGSPGGSTIITSVLQTILNVYEFGLPMQEAVNAARFHHQWLPDEIVFEPKRFDSLLLEKLKEKNYIIKEQNSRIIGKVNAFLMDPNGNITTGADPRGDDSAAIY